MLPRDSSPRNVSAVAPAFGIPARASALAITQIRIATVFQQQISQIVCGHRVIFGEIQRLLICRLGGLPVARPQAHSVTV